MAGPNLEVFKFGLYVFFPVAMMFHFGNPDWYDKHIVPFKEKFWPPEESTVKPPHDSAALQAELARLKAERHARRDASTDTPRMV